MHATAADTGDSPTGTRDGVLVLCLGNDLLRDDGVGWAVADALELSLAESRIPPVAPQPAGRPFGEGGSPESLEVPMHVLIFGKDS